MQFNNLGKQWETIKDNTLPQIDSLGFEGSYINGKAVLNFEEQFAKYFDTKYAVGVSNGTDGLKIALQLFNLNQNDLVIIPANTFIADYIAVKNLPDSKPSVCLIDHDEYFTIDTNQLENFLKNSRKNWRKIVVMAVHLYGNSCDMDKLQKLKDEYNLILIEDCSQSHQTKYHNFYLGNYGDVSVYSLYPGKNLGALGDAGIITTNNPHYYERIKSLRNYGSKVKYHYDELGNNHRLDSIQAIVLSEKLKHLEKWTSIKNEIANRFIIEINNDKIELPVVRKDTKHSWHIFCVKVDNRKNFENHLNNNQIPSIIHYPIPIHQTKIFDETDIIHSSKNTDEFANHIISLPIHPFLSEDEITKIIEVCNSY